MAGAGAQLGRLHGIAAVKASSHEEVEERADERDDGRAATSGHVPTLAETAGSGFTDSIA